MAVVFVCFYLKFYNYNLIFFITIFIKILYIKVGIRTLIVKFYGN